MPPRNNTSMCVWVENRARFSSAVFFLLADRLTDRSNGLLLIGETIVNRTYGTHKKTINFPLFTRYLIPSDINYDVPRSNTSI